MSDLYEIQDNSFNYYHYQHARAHRRACKHTHTHTPPSPFRFDGSVAPKRDIVNAPFRMFRWQSYPVAGSLKKTRAGDPISSRFWKFKKKLLGRTETRTRDRLHCQSIRTV